MLLKQFFIYKIHTICFHLSLLDSCDGGVARGKFEVIKEGWFDSDRASNGVRDERDAGGGSGGGRMRRGMYGSMSMVATRKSLR